MSFPQLKVLLLSADETVEKLVRAFLEENSSSCEIVEDINSAYVSVQNTVFDMIILDVEKENYSSLSAFIQDIRSSIENRYIPFLLLTETSHDNIIAELLNIGANDYIHKPLTKELFAIKLKVNSQDLRYCNNYCGVNVNKTLSEEQGKVLFCGSEFSHHSWTECASYKYEYAEQIDELYDYIQNDNIWIIVVSASCNWVFSNQEKIIEVTNGNTPTVVFGDCEFKLKDTGSNYILSTKDTIENQALFLDVLYRRELQLKVKYKNAFNIAAEKTTMNFDRYFDAELNNINVSILYEPFRSLPGGDFYEVFSVDNHRKVIFFGDIMGKSWDAWFFAPAYIAYIRSIMKFLQLSFKTESIEPQEILTTLNAYISKDLRFSDVFTTLNIVVLNTSSGELKFASAGAIAPLYYNHSENSVSEIENKGLIIGLIPDYIYQKKHICLKSGDKLLFYTDGYPEASILIDNNIGKRAVSDVFEKMKNRSDLTAIEFEDAFIAEYDIRKFEDDRTLMLISMK